VYVAPHYDLTWAVEDDGCDGEEGVSILFSVTCDGALAGRLCCRLLSHEYPTRRAFDFQAFCEPITQELADMSVDLFMSYGQLRPSLRGDVWDDSLDSGNILVIERAMLDAAHRGKKLLPKILAAMEAREVRKKFDFAFMLTRPGTLNDVVPHGMEGLAAKKTDICHVIDQASRKPLSAKQRKQSEAAGDKLVKAWRAAGFRRVGSSCWHARVPLPRRHPDLAHPCHDVTAADPEDKEADVWPGVDRNGATARVHIQDPLITAMYQQRRRPMCSCGECIENVLSPATRHQLVVAADMARDELSMELDQFTKFQPRDRGELRNGIIDFLPTVPQEVFKSYVGGIVEVLAALRRVGNQKKLPTVSGVRAALISGDKRYVNHFLDKGGEVGHVLSYLLHHMRETTGDHISMDIDGNGIMSVKDTLREGPPCDMDFDYHDALPNCMFDGMCPPLPVGYTGRFPDSDDDSFDDEEESDYDLDDDDEKSHDDDY
jgi:hypothetical protein